MTGKKKAIVAVCALLVVVAVVLVIWLVKSPSSDTSDGSKSITVEVLHSDGSTKTYTYSTDAEYLGEVLNEEGLIEGEDGYYTSVDGETASWEEDSAYWAFYVDGEYASVGIDDTPISDGDSFSLEYTKG